jgi:putrescine aminotransferase
MTKEPSGCNLPKESTASAGRASLPIQTQDLISGLTVGQTLDLEKKHGNADLIRALDILGIGGPFRVVNPWTLEDPNGLSLINAGGYAALPFGEAYPPLIQFITTFLTENRGMGLPQQSASEWRAALETNLVSLLAQEAPSHADSGVFFTNSGAEAVETAIKFARASRPKGKHLINFTSAYHGKTLGALSLTPNASFQTPFAPLIPGILTLPYGDPNALEAAILKCRASSVTAIVLEPIQGEAGVVIPPPEFLPAVAQLSRRHDILVVADEVQTGLGRSGHNFASIAGGLEPDIITLAKPLGGGLVPVGATIVRRSIYKKVLGGLDSKRHSNTFGGGSLAMAVALRSLELIVEEGLVESSKRNGEAGLAKLEQIRRRHPAFIRNVRGAGMLFAIELHSAVPSYVLPVGGDTVRTLSTGLAVRELHLGGVHACFSLNASSVLRLTPPLNIPTKLFSEMFSRIDQVAQRNRSSWRMLRRMPPDRLLRLARLAVKR